jgi:hypothetical protein
VPLFVLYSYYLTLAPARQVAGCSIVVVVIGPMYFVSAALWHGFHFSIMFGANYLLTVLVVPERHST